MASPVDQRFSVEALKRLERIAVQAAREAGALLLGLQTRTRFISRKGPTDLVTDADTSAEALIRTRLGQRTPSASFIGEEGGEIEFIEALSSQVTEHEAENELDSGLTWIVDPLDGTTNYAMGVPHYAVSIAAAVDNEVIAGAVFDPSRDEMFSASRGGGTFLNGKAIHVSAATNLKDAVVATGMTAGLTDGDRGFAEACAINLSSLGIRKNGAAALDLAWVASGRFGAYFQDRLSPWDVAAGTLLVEEAGGRVTARLGGAFNLVSGEILATNGHLHTSLSRLLSRVAE